MREYAIFSGKNSLMSRSRRHMINISINGSYSLEVVNLGDSLRSSEIFITALCEAHSWSVFILFEWDNVMTDTVQVVSCGQSRRFRTPWVCGCRIFLVLWLLNHAIEQVLECSLLCRRLWADMISWASRESHCLIAETVTIEFAVCTKSKIVCALRGAMRYLAYGYTCVIFIQSYRFARPMHRLNGISTNEVGKVLDRVYARVALLAFHETSVRAHRLRLRCVSLVHCHQ